MSTGTSDKVLDNLRGRSALTADEKKIAQDHVEKRDFVGGSNTPPNNPQVTSNRNHRFYLAIKVLIVVIAMLVGAVIVLFINDANVRADKLATAHRELQGYADTLNKKLPAENQVVINSVTYKSGGFETMIVKVIQGKTVCTAQVNPPDDKHHLYWSSHLGEVPVDQIDTADYKCIESVGWPGMGDI